jgi:protein-tyrosine phosphatase
MDWITDQIAIGNFLDAQNPPAGIDAILCLKPQCCDEARTDVSALCIALKDGAGNRREDVLEAIDFISETVTAGERVLVHCHAGRSRSVCVVAAYLMKHSGLSRSGALAIIETKREVWLSEGIDEIFGFLA